MAPFVQNEGTQCRSFAQPLKRTAPNDSLIVYRMASFSSGTLSTGRVGPLAPPKVFALLYRHGSPHAFMLPSVASYSTASAMYAQCQESRTNDNLTLILSDYISVYICTQRPPYLLAHLVKMTMRWEKKIFLSFMRYFLENALFDRLHA